MRPTPDRTSSGTSREPMSPEAPVTATVGAAMGAAAESVMSVPRLTVWPTILKLETNPNL